MVALRSLLALLLISACGGGGVPPSGFDGGSPLTCPAEGCVGGLTCPGTDLAGAPPNLLSNPGFECGVDGWHTTGPASLDTEREGSSGVAKLTATSASAA